MQIELEHMSRMNLMSEFSSSIAHELSQPLSAISNYAHGNLQSIEQNNVLEPEDIKSSFKAIEAQSNRAGNIVRRLRSLSKKEMPLREKLQLGKIIDDTLSFLDFEIKQQGIKVSNPEPSERMVLADKVLLQQLFINVFINAMDAMMNQTTRQLSIDASEYHDIISVYIRDAGCGITDKNLNQVCDAFFTTKEKGLSMGLAICTSILEQHQGSLTLKSCNNGTTAIIQLPLHKATV